MTTVRDVVAEIIDLPPPDLDAPGPFRYGDADKLLGLLNRAGFADLQVRDWHRMLPIGGGLSAPEAANFALASFSSFGEMLASSGDEALHNARHLLTERFSQHQHKDIVHMDACVHIFTGTRPA